MIHPEIEQLVDWLRTRFMRLAEISPVLVLDETWPSVGTLDLFTYALRSAEQRPDDADQLYRAAAAYLGKIAHDSWSELGIDVELGLTEHGVLIGADGGERLQGAQSQIFLERALRQVLAMRGEPIPIALDFDRLVPAHYNYLSLFSLGVVLGISPFNDGTLLDPEHAYFGELLEKLVKYQARSTGRFYARVYEDEPLGEVAEVYLKNMIYPPSTMLGGFPALGAVAPVIGYLKEIGAQPLDIMQFAKNSACSPDEHISSVGLAIYAALAETPLSPRVAAAAESKALFMGLLRPALVAARHALGYVGDWLESGKLTLTDLSRLSIEIQLGFFPWLKLTPAKVHRSFSDPSISGLLRAISGFDYRGALKACDVFLEEFPGDIEMQVQRNYMYMIGGDTEKAKVAFRQLLTEPGADHNAELFHLWGLCEMALGNLEEAERQLRRALNVCQSNSPEERQIASNAAFLLLARERFEEAVEKATLSVNNEIFPLGTRLNLWSALTALGRKAQADAVKNQLFLLCPTDRRVVALGLDLTV